VNRRDCIDKLDLDKQAPIDHQIRTISAIELYPFVYDWDRSLPLE